jgi:hypothetical protein
MHKTTLSLLLLTSLTLQPLVAVADHDEQNRRNWADSNALEWRLGSGRRDGHTIFYREAGARQWYRAPGAAVAVGDGWVLGTDRRNGGYGIYRWNGDDWQRMPGAAVDIGGSFHSPWVINDRGQHYRWTGDDWRLESHYRRHEDVGERRDEDRGRRGDRRRERDR